MAQENKDKILAVKRIIRLDKRVHMDELATEEQAAAERDVKRTVYSTTKTLTGNKSNKSTIVKDKNGNVLTKEDEQLNIFWPFQM